LVSAGVGTREAFGSLSHHAVTKAQFAVSQAGQGKRNSSGRLELRQERRHRQYNEVKNLGVRNRGKKKTPKLSCCAGKLKTWFPDISKKLIAKKGNKGKKKT